MVGLFIYFGLSLCIQGTQQGSRDIAAYVRFIPVYTGNTLVGCPCNVLNAVYPCVYREHGYIFVFECSTHGLSLCIQGTPIKMLLH